MHDAACCYPVKPFPAVGVCVSTTFQPTNKHAPKKKGPHTSASRRPCSVAAVRHTALVTRVSFIVLAPTREGSRLSPARLPPSTPPAPALRRCLVLGDGRALTAPLWLASVLYAAACQHRIAGGSKGRPRARRFCSIRDALCCRCCLPRCPFAPQGRHVAAARLVCIKAESPCQPEGDGETWQAGAGA